MAIPRFYLFCIIAILFILSCSVTDSNTETCSKENSSVFFPDVIGSTWEYRLWQGYEDQVDELITRRVLGNYQININDEILNAHSVSYSEDEEIIWLNWNGPDGLYSLGGISPIDTFLVKSLYLKYPCTPGESWSVPRIRWDGFFFIHDTLEMQCVNIDVPVITDIDTFLTVHFSLTIPPEGDIPNTFVFDEFYTPGIGLIKSTMRNMGGEPFGRSVLKDYCLKQ